ncbi:hypothetical protein VUR80DRAFT_9247 [Thermomyces stellatus]
MKREEVEVKREVDEDVNTQTESFAEFSREARAERTTGPKMEMWKDSNVGRMPEIQEGKGKGPEAVSSSSTPPTGSRLPLRPVPPASEPVAKGSYTLEAVKSRPVPQGSSSRPGPSTPRKTCQKWIDDSEIMQYLVGGMTNLAIPMAQDDGGRWRIHRRQ